MRLVYLALDAAAHDYFALPDNQVVPPAYRQRLQKKTHAQARLETLAGLWLLQQALPLAGHDALSAKAVAIDAEGRPHFAQGPAFSLSHSPRYAVCAMAEQGEDISAVGVDVEVHRPMRQRFMQKLCSADEFAQVQAKQSRFFDFWCAREATVKATGRVGLKRIRQVQIHAEQAQLDNQHWFLHWPQLDSAATFCLATSQPVQQLHIQQLSLAAA